MSDMLLTIVYGVLVVFAVIYALTPLLIWGELQRLNKTQKEMLAVLNAVRGELRAVREGGGSTDG